MHEFPEGLRIATEADERSIFDLLKAAHADNGFGRMSRSKVWDMIRRATRDKFAVIAIAPGTERIEAAVCLDSTTEWYSDEWFYVDRFLFVHPEHRRSGHDLRLLRFVQWWAQETGATVSFGIYTRKRLAAKGRLYGRFARQVGVSFVIERELAQQAKVA